MVGLEPGWMTASILAHMSGIILGSQIPGIYKNEREQYSNKPLDEPIFLPKELYDRIKPYTSSHTVWCGIVPDYMMSEAQRILINHFKKHQLNLG